MSRIQPNHMCLTISTHSPSKTLQELGSVEARSCTSVGERCSESRAANNSGDDAVYIIAGSQHHGHLSSLWTIYCSSSPSLCLSHGPLSAGILPAAVKCTICTPNYTYCSAVVSSHCIPLYAGCHTPQNVTQSQINNYGTRCIRLL